VIIISLNYRLGAFGWSSGPSYQAEGGTANVGLYDQRFALEWVQQYIHLFGGDKNRVTVFGESAGGGSIMHQITAYGGLKGKAPFQQAIPQSPGWQAVQSNIQMEDTYRTFLNLTNTTSLAELRALPYETLRRANVQQVAYTTAWGQFAYGPTVDGNFVPQQPGQLLAQGRFDKDVNVMVGHNANEGPSFTAPFIQTDAELRKQLNTGYPYMPNSSVDHIVEVLYPPVFDGSYPYTTQYQRATLIISEGAFTCNNYYLAKAYKNETYNYLFAVPPAFHGFDVAYTFFLGGDTSLLPTDVNNRTVAFALQDFITSFAEKGAPEAPGITMFDMYGENASVMRLNITGIDEIRDVNANKRCDWWQLALFS
jgi:acetylcholinesterase